MKKQIISLYDYTGVAVEPWARSGYECFCYDIQHTAEGETVRYEGGGSITKISMDLQETCKDDKGFEFYPFIFKLLKRHSYKAHIVFGFSPCDHLAVSGAAHFKDKAIRLGSDFQVIATNNAKACAMLGSLLEVPYMVENPVSRLATLWRKPDYCFQPFEYGAYIPESEVDHPLYPDYIAPRDAYSKKTCLWTGGGFKMPKKKPVDCESFGSSRQHRKLGGKSMRTKNIRSATPRGFARAVFEANRAEVEA